MSRKPRPTGPSGRAVRAGAGVESLSLAISARVASAAAPAVTITPELVVAARKTGEVHWYSAMDQHVGGICLWPLGGRHPLASIEIMPDDPEAMLADTNAIKKRYAQIFRV